MYEYKIIKKNKQIVVTVSVSPGKLVVVKQSLIEEILANEGYEYDKLEVIQVGPRITNENPDQSTMWVFHKKTVDKTPKPVVSSNSAKRTKKSSKPQDE
tara:strand:- start:691 stop:987 length:297 start_codon:yes stop_codon:yes gene_type:complete